MSEDQKPRSELIVYEDQVKGAYDNEYPKVVLKEEEYVSKIEEIVERDYFPDLERLRLQKEYQDALDANDLNKIGSIQEEWGRLLEKEAKSEFPEASIPNEASLDSFMSQHTSEDNVSFNEIVKESQKSTKNKYWWLHNNDNDDIEKNKALLPQEKLLLGYGEPTKQKDALALINSLKYKTRNALMFNPDHAKYTDEELLALNKGRPMIQNKNTRISRDHTKGIEILSNAIKSSLTKSKTVPGQVGVDGKTQESIDNNYSMVVTPSPAPGVGESPLMTWGEINATPLRIDTPALSFKMPETPAREELLFKLDSENIKKRAKATPLTTSQVQKKSKRRREPMTPAQRLKYLSPAAQLLACRSGIVATPSPLRSNLTPKLTPMVTPGSSRASLTPVAKTPTTFNEGQSNYARTDNLLNNLKR